MIVFLNFEIFHPKVIDSIIETARIILNSVDQILRVSQMEQTKIAKGFATIPWGRQLTHKAIRAQTRQRILRVFVEFAWLHKLLLSVPHTAVYPILSPRLHKSLLSATGVKCSCTRCYWVDGYFSRDGEWIRETREHSNNRRIVTLPSFNVF